MFADINCVFKIREMTIDDVRDELKANNKSSPFYPMNVIDIQLKPKVNII